MGKGSVSDRLLKRRFAKLLRKAALGQVRGELDSAAAALDSLFLLLEQCEERQFEPLQEFVQEWTAVIANSPDGVVLSATPAAWVHLAQELADFLEADRNWKAYLDSRWQLRGEQWNLRKRFGYGVCGFSCLVLGCLVFYSLGRGVWMGSLDAAWLDSSWRKVSDVWLVAILLGRLAGSLFMLHSGYFWLRGALAGRGPELSPSFLLPKQKLALVKGEEVEL